MEIVIRIFGIVIELVLTKILTLMWSKVWKFLGSAISIELKVLVFGVRLIHIGGKIDNLKKVE